MAPPALTNHVVALPAAPSLGELFAQRPTQLAVVLRRRRGIQGFAPEAQQDGAADAVAGARAAARCGLGGRADRHTGTDLNRDAVASSALFRLVSLARKPGQPVRRVRKEPITGFGTQWDARDLGFWSTSRRHSQTVIQIPARRTQTSRSASRPSRWTASAATCCWSGRTSTARALSFPASCLTTRSETSDD